MQNIKNIIFDLGGVFIEIDYPKTEKAFIKLGVINFNEFYNQHHASDLFENLETGKASADEFYDAFREKIQTDLSNADIKNAWNAMLGKFYPKHLKLLEKLRDQYKVVLFSNTNIIHYEAFQKIYREQTGNDTFDDYFIAAHYSHVLGLRKPYPEAFKAVLQKENLVAKETLFIDDTIKNIEGAKKVGLNTIWLESPETLIDALKQ
ncbi:MAG TPA: HAD family phosphatase [Segetibacter sp.]|jgi:putative hydrolase of the HAD superfamily